MNARSHRPIAHRAIRRSVDVVLHRPGAAHRVRSPYIGGRERSAPPHPFSGRVGACTCVDGVGAVCVATLDAPLAVVLLWRRCPRPDRVGRRRTGGAAALAHDRPARRCRPCMGTTLGVDAAPPGVARASLGDRSARGGGARAVDRPHPREHRLLACRPRLRHAVLRRASPSLGAGGVRGAKRARRLGGVGGEWRSAEVAGRAGRVSDLADARDHLRRPLFAVGRASGGAAPAATRRVGGHPRQPRRRRATRRHARGAAACRAGDSRHARAGLERDRRSPRDGRAAHLDRRVGRTHPTPTRSGRRAKAWRRHDA